MNKTRYTKITAVQGNTNKYICIGRLILTYVNNYLSMLMATKLNIDEVLQITSIAM